MYGEFQNKQLQSGQEYVLFVLAVVEMLENVSINVSGYFSGYFNPSFYHSFLQRHWGC